MRSYNQYCALARALDVIGDRWTLLIIRELFAHDARYSDLRDALPGIATNLLADRLRHLSAHGVIEIYDAPAPVRASVYRLTERGRQLGPALASLAAWGGDLLGNQGDDEFRIHWMALGLPTFFDDADVSDLAPLDVVVRTGGAEATLTVGEGGVTMNTDRSPETTPVTVKGAPEQVVALLTGRTEGHQEVAVDGPEDAIRRLHALAGRATSTPSRSDV
jgi:DNA-binding HxlR family transcriptional regulator